MINKSGIFLVFLLLLCSLWTTGCTKEKMAKPEPTAKATIFDQPSYITYGGPDTYINGASIHTINTEEEIEEVWQALDSSNWEQKDTWQTQANSVIDLDFDVPAGTARLTLTIDGWASYWDDSTGDNLIYYQLPYGTYAQVATVLTRFSKTAEDATTIDDVAAFITDFIEEPMVVAVYDSYYTPIEGDAALIKQFGAALGNIDAWEDSVASAFPQEGGELNCAIYTSDETAPKSLRIVEEDGINYINISYNGKEFYYRTTEAICQPLRALIKANAYIPSE